MSASYRLVAFDSEQPPPLEDLALLHAELLPRSPVALLGPLFMKKFYYRLLPPAGLICGGTAYVDDEAAGFIVGTADSHGFMRVAIKRFWPRLALVMAEAVLRAPARVAAIWEAWRIMSSLQLPVGKDRTGELLSFGVLPRYRERRFVHESGLRIGADLLELGIDQLRERRVESVRAVVDEDNLEAKLFYHTAGWTPGASSVPGWRVPSVEFICSLASAAPRDCPSVSQRSIGGKQT